MRKINIFVLFGVISLLIIIPLLFFSKFIPSKEHYATVKISGVVVKAEIADTQAKRIEGLMSKQTLPDKQGMLFIFDNESYHGIWMINMSFPIDILWIDKNLKIIDLVENARPCGINCPVYLPDEKALYVLEVNSGFVAKNNLSVGESIKIG